MEWSIEKHLTLQCRVAEIPHQRETVDAQSGPSDLLGSLRLRNGAKYVPCLQTGENRNVQDSIPIAYTPLCQAFFGHRWLLQALFCWSKKMPSKPVAFGAQIDVHNLIRTSDTLLNSHHYQQFICVWIEDLTLGRRMYTIETNVGIKDVDSVRN